MSTALAECLLRFGAPTRPRSKRRVTPATGGSDPHEVFHDLVIANSEYAEKFHAPKATGVARRGLAIVTCIDSRIDPLRMMGLTAGDAKILRNAGARVTDDVVNTLVLTTHLLGVDRILVMPHTDCRMTAPSDQVLHEEIMQASGVDTHSLQFPTVSDQRAALAHDVARILNCPYLKAGTVVAGGIYDVHKGRLDLLV
jgi:carbonic anhydrase